MKIGCKPKPESSEEMRLVHHALENSTRRKMLILMNEGLLTIEEMARSIGPTMLDYHLHRLEFAGLIEVDENKIVLTDSGKAYGALVRSQAEKGGADKV
ncbi:MAG: winged helix-turn-helix domain-containing protein [Methanotrichaceae archaeon]|nr:winged helix-turn-helix domain-containing protein [Methanotrichaceae archaeon]